VRVRPSKRARSASARLPLRITTTVRLDDATLARVDTLVAALSTEWRKVTRAEVLRAVIGKGIKAEERRARRKAGGRAVKDRAPASSGHPHTRQRAKLLVPPPGDAAPSTPRKQR
jgi:hypothetical protein